MTPCRISPRWIICGQHAASRQRPLKPQCSPARPSHPPMYQLLRLHSHRRSTLRRKCPQRCRRQCRPATPHHTQVWCRVHRRRGVQRCQVRPHTCRHSLLLRSLHLRRRPSQPTSRHALLHTLRQSPQPLCPLTSPHTNRRMSQRLLPLFLRRQTCPRRVRPGTQLRPRQKIPRNGQHASLRRSRLSCPRACRPRIPLPSRHGDLQRCQLPWSPHSLPHTLRLLSRHQRPPRRYRAQYPATHPRRFQAPRQRWHQHGYQAR